MSIQSIIIITIIIIVIIIIIIIIVIVIVVSGFTKNILLGFPNYELLALCGPDQY